MSRKTKDGGPGRIQLRVGYVPVVQANGGRLARTTVKDLVLGPNAVVFPGPRISSNHPWFART